MFDPENDLVTSENILTGTCISWQSTFLSSRGNHVKAPSGCRAVILSSQGTKRSHLNPVKAPLRGRKVIMSSQGTKRSRFSTDGEERKERLPRYARLGLSSRGTKRSRFSTDGNSQKRDCRAALAMTKNAVARNVAISVFYRWQTTKGEIAALRSPRFVIARNVAILIFYRWQQPKERLPRCARNDKK